MARHIQIVLSNPASGDRDREYNEWYDGQHIPDLMGLKGFVGATRYRVVLPFAGKAPWSYMVLYELETEDLSAMLAELVDAHGDGRIAVSDVLDPASLTALVFSPVAAFQGTPGHRRQLFVALSKPSEGREDEFNTWYDGRHVPDVIAIDGIFGAERFKLAIPFLDPIGLGERYLAVYDVDCPDLRDLAARVAADARSGRAVMSDAIDMKSLTAFFLEPV
ncbi:hypothetical protein L2U69_01495 [Zavarzinia compransoris]|uniref:DUF4286 family protein n=1 Tax=Zavarzinia marina TaxID=2911065 RepID=UPI001F1C7777|nr:DUF4286 family protein [Zavarzinia marina]MCF4164319.1 hypothetical protein [Zavarzinia marina]